MNWKILIFFIMAALCQESLQYGGSAISQKERSCVVETGADVDEYNWVLVLPQVSRETQCALLCYFKFLGYFDSDGDLLESGFAALRRRLGEKRSTDICENLLYLDEPDKCKLALMFAKCEDKFHPMRVA